MQLILKWYRKNIFRKKERESEHPNDRADEGKKG